jgi:hypothetical protein
MQHRPSLYTYLVVGKMAGYKTNLTTGYVSSMTGNHVGTHKKGK